jgi:hypothetical protein
LMNPIKMHGVPHQHSRSRFAVKQDLCRLLDVVGAPAIGSGSHPCCLVRRCQPHGLAIAHGASGTMPWIELPADCD